MTKFIFNLFYGLPLRNIIAYMVVLTIFWQALGRLLQIKLQKKASWKIVNFLLTGIFAVIILLITVASRESTRSEIILRPFQSFTEAKIQPEMYRSMLMNIFLFFPLGLTLPYAFPEKCKHSAAWTILTAAVLSIIIEYLQYHFQLGRAETDDVLCNTLGAAIGSLGFLLPKITSKLKMMGRYKES